MGELLPIVSVVITTHNRTNVACAVIDSLCKNLIYKRINWIISDDRSDKGHIEKLLEQFKQNDITNVTVCKNEEGRFGLGASMNNGLKEAFKKSEIVLTTEDDWILEKQLNLAYYVNLINKDNNIAGIRLAALCYAKTRPSQTYSDMLEVYTQGILGSVFNNQVMLRHKRVYDKLGYYRENCSSDISEQDMITRFNKHSQWNEMNVLFPKFIKQKTLDDESLMFIHVGKSTQEHSYIVPKRYEWIYDGNVKNICDIQNSNLKNNELPIVTVIITTHNRTNVACAVIDSLCKHLKYDGNIKWCISDDRSNPGHTFALLDQFNKNKIFDVHIERTSKTSWGLGASLNNGLKYAWTNSDITLTTEDDMLFTRNYNITNDVKTLINDKRIGGIRYGQFDKCFNNCPKYNEWYCMVTGCNSSTYIFNNQIMLRHKRVYDKLGLYKECIDSDQQELEYVMRFNRLLPNEKFLILRPVQIECKPFNEQTNHFIQHIGISVVNNPIKRRNCTINRLYDNLNNNQKDIELQKSHFCLVGIATYDKRIKFLNNTLKNLLHQCDRINVALNGYTVIPDFLIRDEKIHYYTTNEKFPDLGCNNKMAWIDETTGYYLTCDDDINYPPNYIERLIQSINKYNKKCVCSFHGIRFVIENGFLINPYSNRKVFIYRQGVNKDMWMDMPGGATQGFYPSKINIKSQVYLSKPKNSGDDEITSIFCQENNIPIIRPSTTEDWISFNNETQEFSLWKDTKSVIQRWNKMALYGKWKHNMGGLE